MSGRRYFRLRQLIRRKTELYGIHRKAASIGAMRLFFLFTLAATVLMADATGKWKGTLTPEGQNGGPALLVLKQDGTSLTGTAGPDETGQHAILNGKVEGGKITFELAVGQGNAKFTLLQDGEEIKGDVKLEGGGQTQAAKIELKRAK